MYYFRYPLVDGGPDGFLPVATTRPETILGDGSLASIALNQLATTEPELVGMGMILTVCSRHLPCVVASPITASGDGFKTCVIMLAHDTCSASTRRHGGGGSPGGSAVLAPRRAALRSAADRQACHRSLLLVTVQHLRPHPV
jgi:hypothetical protein